MTDAVVVAPAPTPAVAPSAPQTAPVTTPSAPAPENNRPTPPVIKQAYTAADAGRALRAQREKLREQAAATAAAAPPAPAVDPAAAPLDTPSSPPASEADPLIAVLSETHEVDPAATPSIEPPRSWKKEYWDAFKALPQNLQEQVAENERVREADHSQRQNEVAQRQQAFEAELAAVQQSRQGYEQGLQQLLQMTMANDEFADITSQQALDNLAATDWPKWIRYQNQLQKVSYMKDQLSQVQQQSNQEQLGRWNAFAQEQDALFSQKMPNAKELRVEAGTYLEKVGFSPAEINAYWNSPGWRDHRTQGMIAKAILYDKAVAKAAAARKAPVPEVMKPGVAGPKANAFAQQISDLESKKSLTVREASDLRRMRRMAAQPS